jgi:hypothetical protein
MMQFSCCSRVSVKRPANRQEIAHALLSAIDIRKAFHKARGTARKSPLDARAV